MNLNIFYNKYNTLKFLNEKFSKKSVDSLNSIEIKNLISKIENHLKGFELNSEFVFSKLSIILKEKTIKIFRSRSELNDQHKEPGQIETNGKDWIRYSAKDGFIYVEEMQLEGKKRMKILDFLRGYRP